MTFAPGKHCASTHGFRWERDLDLDLRVLANEERVDVLVSLVEDVELPRYQIGDLFLRAVMHGIEVHRLPIADVDTPSNNEDVTTLLAAMRAHVAAGRRVAVHCIGGLGRTGTIVGCYLVSTGTAPAAALDLLRRLRGARCPETLAQRSFVARWSGPKQTGRAERLT
jgi:protein-tyrosine phosphatase